MNFELVRVLFGWGPSDEVSSDHGTAWDEEVNALPISDIIEIGEEHVCDFVAPNMTLAAEWVGRGGFGQLPPIPEGVERTEFRLIPDIEEGGDYEVVEAELNRLMAMDDKSSFDKLYDEMFGIAEGFIA
ncbi:MAG: hypothetical protein Q7K54_00950 [Candidatus Parcubacteria bacterium]|nr:hypothetical protein [Candidatus Parcubacteria bacterium]